MCEINRFGIKIIGGIPEKQGKLLLRRFAAQT